MFRLFNRLGVGYRIEIYEALSLLIENGVLLNDALHEMYEVMSNDGKNPRYPCAIALRDCMTGMADGRPLSTTLAKWVSPEECSLIAAGEKTGRLADDRDGPGAFTQAIRIITAKRRILRAIQMATFYPAMLFMLVAVLLNIISTQVVPNIEKIVPPENWEGPAVLLGVISQFVKNYGDIALTVLITTCVVIFVSLPYLRGSVRLYADKVPPWSVYRTLHGSTFLLNVAVLLQAGVKLQDTLTLLSETANPWLKERIDSAKYGIRIGGNLGQALYRAGYDFPSRRAVRYLVILSSRQGFEVAINRFADRWLNESVRNIEMIAAMALTCGVLTVGVLILLILFGVSSIQDMITSSF
jgi:type II secretory pathway component PulF